MHTTAIMSLMPFISRQAGRSTTLPALVETRPETTQPQPAEQPAILPTMFNRISAVILLALLDITCVLWICPLAIQLAEWAGVSYLNAAYIGLAAMLAALPVALATTILVRRKLQNRGTHR
jgi:hypothetical protein